MGFIVLSESDKTIKPNKMKKKHGKRVGRVVDKKIIRVERIIEEGRRDEEAERVKNEHFTSGIKCIVQGLMHRPG